MTSTLRLFTRGGKVDTFATTLVEDAYTRPLRALVDGGWLSMNYTGTQRVYTLTPEGKVFLEGKRMGKKKVTENKDAPPPPVRAANEAPPARRERKKREPAAKVTPPAAPRKKPAVNGVAHPPAAPRPRSATPVSPLEVIRLMREVRDYAEAHEGVPALLAMLKRVEEIGHRFGGLDCVRESLEAIQEFRGEK